MTQTLSIDTNTEPAEQQAEAQLSPNSIIKQCHQDDKQEKAAYYNSCQEVLNDIKETTELVHTLEEMEDVYYPTSTSTFKVLQIDNLETLSDSIPQLLQIKLSDCLQHLHNLADRVSDPSSKVLVTGDLNSGKSTLVNALLKKDVLPVDQQPCTSVFCEVYSTQQQQEEDCVHAIQDITAYSRENKDTFHPLATRHLYKTLTDENIPYKMLKIYTARDNAITEDSLLHNGVVDIALIDSPGLNTDSIKTTAVFAREEEIDVVVFVVSAENHFTLSGKEFLWNAANEKTHIFIVVNRFDNIRDKERCKKSILEQIKTLSPATYAQADDLVHFVSAGHGVDAPEFAKLEQRLRSFVLHNRIQSKLLPVKNYVTNTLRDVHFISNLNQDKSLENLDKANEALEVNFLPGFSTLIKTQKSIQTSIRQLIDNSNKSIENKVSRSLQAAISDDALDECIYSVTFPGIHLSWQYAQNISDALASHLEAHLQQVETEASKDVVSCMNDMNQLTESELKQCGMDDITTQVHEGILDTQSKHRPIRINVQARDFLMDRRIVDDRKVAAVGLGGVGATVALFKAINIKELALNFISRYLNPLDSPTADLPSRRFVSYTMTTLTVLGAGWTVYSFVSAVPKALQKNLKHKFRVAVENEGFRDNQTHRILHGVNNLLESKETEISYRIQEAVKEREQEKAQLEENVFRAKATLNRFRALTDKSNTLLIKVETRKA